jgi:DNA primase
MARIPQGELERLKRETDLAALVRARGVELRPHGSDLLGLCPFHDDNEPSLVVTPAKGLWHCLGACSEGGTVIEHRCQVRPSRRSCCRVSGVLRK